MDGAIGAVALVESPMRRRDDGIRILLCDIARNQPQRCPSDFCLHGRGNDTLRRLTCH